MDTNGLQPLEIDQSIQNIVEHQRLFYNTHTTKPYEYRLYGLKNMQNWIAQFEDKIFDALKSDLGKSGFESYLTEVGIVRDELSFAIKNLKKWMKPVKKPTPLAHFPSKSHIYAVPYGVALIISPWNFPFQCALNPLVGALAAGNCCVVKPSNHAPKTSQIIAEMVADCFDPKHVTVVLGGREQNSDLLKQKFDYIFFTGGAKVGGVVLQSALPNLTPVTLELGGKSPCIVDEAANISYAAKRLVFGKFINAGQTCVAPDYLYVHESKKDQLVRHMIDCIQEFYTEDPLNSSIYPRIVNRQQFDRLLSLMQGEQLLYGGRSNVDTLKIMPTLIDNATWESPLMQEEIFGPLLPIFTFDDLDKVLHTIVSKPHPLAFYLFSTDKKVKKTICECVPFGGGSINDTLVHIATPHLPFGGVGSSGMGSYHGKASFDTFTHYKSILEKYNWMDLPIRYLPGSEKDFKAIRRWMK